jgi:5-methylthioribose kinase
LSYFSQDGHDESPGARDAYREWILATTEGIWTLFDRKFRENWIAHPTGDAYPPDLFQGPLGAARLAAERNAYMQALWRDTVGFAAAKMIRRILGLAHNIDLEWIKHRKLRATCEARALLLARDMMVNPENYPAPGDLTQAARRMRSVAPELNS